MQQFKEELLTNGVGVGCKTEEQAQEYLRWLQSRGIKWSSDEDIESNKNYWGSCRHSTYYRVRTDGLSYGHIQCCPTGTISFEEAKVEEFKRGDRVLVSDDGREWSECIYLATICGARYPYVTVSPCYEQEFLSGDVFDTAEWKHIKSLPQKKQVGMDEITEMLREKYGDSFELNLDTSNNK